jgi:hypothetical protein
MDESSRTLIQHPPTERLRIADFTSTDHLRAKIDQFIQEWNQHAHPFNWSTKSGAQVMAAAPALAA